MKQNKLNKLGIIGLPLKINNQTYYVGLDSQEGENKTCTETLDSVPKTITWETAEFLIEIKDLTKGINLTALKTRYDKLPKKAGFDNVLDKLCLLVWIKIAEFWQYVHELNGVKPDLEKITRPNPMLITNFESVLLDKVTPDHFDLKKLPTLTTVLNQALEKVKQRYAEMKSKKYSKDKLRVGTQLRKKTSGQSEKEEKN